MARFALRDAIVIIVALVALGPSPLPLRPLTIRTCCRCRSTKDTISVRYRGGGRAPTCASARASCARASGRFRPSYPSGSRGSADGGLGAAASGDHSVAAVTGWSRFGGRPGVCAVALGGVDERIIDLPQAEPQIAYLDGMRYTSVPSAATVSGPG